MKGEKMIVKRTDAILRKAEGVDMWNYLTSDSGTSISVALAELHGDHPESVSKMSDRCYLFISGSAKVRVGDEEYLVEAGDVVYVPKKVRHSLSGIASYYVINNPPYKRG